MALLIGLNDHNPSVFGLPWLYYFQTIIIYKLVNPLKYVYIYIHLSKIISIP